MQVVPQWYQEHHVWLINWLCVKVSCLSRAQDLCQDTFVKLLEKQHDSYVKQPRAYLTKIAHGLLVDQCRRNDLEQAYLQYLAQTNPSAAPSMSLEAQQAVVETLCQIDSMLESLPNKVKQAFLMYRLEGCKQKEIAAVLEVSLSTVEKYLKTAMLHCYRVRYGD